MAPAPDLAAYRRFIVAFSGGKDSLAALLHLLALGVPPAAIELHHHEVDGRGPVFMDWPCTPGYVRAIADLLGITLFSSWREGGFARELDRADSPTAPVWFETPAGLGRAGGGGRPGTRGLFPQTSADLRVRWCSPALKIDVLAATIRNQARYQDGSNLVVTGERAAESPARARYRRFEPHRTSTAHRHVDHWRPMLDWSEELVWSIIAAAGIRPHPAYELGWGRLSCRACILMATASLFTIDRDGVLVANPVMGFLIVQSQLGLVRSRGEEVEVQARPSPTLNITAALTAFDIQNRTGLASTIGKVPTMTSLRYICV